MILYCTREMALALKSIMPYAVEHLPDNFPEDVAKGLIAVHETVATWEGEAVDLRPFFGLPPKGAEGSSLDESLKGTVITGDEPGDTATVQDTPPVPPPSA